MTARLAQIAICDRRGPAHKDVGAFVDSVCGAVSIEWRRAGVTGIRILEAELGVPASEGVSPKLKGGADEPVQLLLVTGPGQAPLDRAAVKTFLEQQRQTP
jgi:hypothetical protein